MSVGSLIAAVVAIAAIAFAGHASAPHAP